MKKIVTINMIFLSMVGCTDQVTEKSYIKENSSKPAVTENITVKDAAIFQKFEESTYDRTDLKERLENHKIALASLSDSGIFKAISIPLVKELSFQHQSFFSKNPQYELLSVAKGALTSSEENDRVFIVFDKDQSIIKILVYQTDKNGYRLLYQTVKVENGLEDADCNHFAFGTLDYQMGEEIIDQKEFLEKNVGQFLLAEPIILNGLKEDENFAPDHGCFSKGMSIAKKVRFIAIPTSQVYSNWECLTYQSASDSFLLFYGQAFAD